MIEILSIIWLNLQSFLHTHGYWMVFLGAIFEAPTLATAGSFAASLGYLNVFLVFIFAVLGNITGDAIHFAAGHLFRKGIIEKYGKRFGLGHGRIRFLEHNFKRHLGKVMLFLKLFPPATSAGLLLIGSSKIKAKKFIPISLLVSIPICLFYTLLGFFLGSISTTILKYLRLGQFTLLFLVIAVVIAYFIAKAFSNKVEKIDSKRF